MTETPVPLAETETIDADGTTTRFRTVMHRRSTVGGIVSFERAHDDTGDVYRSLALSGKHHDALGAPEQVTVTVEPGDRINDPLTGEPAEAAEQQIERLAAFIMRHVPGEPSRSEGAVDTAIRLLSATVATETGTGTT